MEIRQELKRWCSQYADGTLMYPGEWLCTFARFGGVWVMVSMVPYVEAKQVGREG